MRKIDIRAWYTHELSHESVKAADGKSFSWIVHFEQKHELGAKGAGSLGLSRFVCVCELSAEMEGDATLKFHLPVPKVPSVWGLISKVAFLRKTPSPLDS